MITINCTKKLAKRVPFPLAGDVQPSTNRLGPWCANTFNAGRFPLVLLTNERTLLSVVIPFKEVRTLHSRFLSALEVLLHSLALSSNQIHAELKEMHEVQFTDHTKRQVLGSMNDFVNGVLAHEPGDTLEGISFDLSGTPCSPLNYGTPQQAVLEVFDPPPHRTPLRSSP